MDHKKGVGEQLPVAERATDLYVNVSFMRVAGFSISWSLSVAVPNLVLWSGFSQM